MADRFRLDEVREIFRDDVARLIGEMRGSAAQLLKQPGNAAALEQIRGAGHSLRGSAGLVGLTYLSRAGAAVEYLVENLDRGAGETRRIKAFARQLAAAIDQIEALATTSLNDIDAGLHENVYTEFTLLFPEDVRRELVAIDVGSLPPAEAPVEAAPAGGDDPAWEAQLAEIFLEELRENLTRVPVLVAGLAEQHQRRQAFYDLSRVFHTIKGSAAMVGRHELSELGRILQDAFGSAAESAEINPDDHTTIQSTMAQVFAAAQMLAPTLPTPATAVEDEPDIDPELMEAFAIDADEALSATERVLLELETQPDNTDSLRSLFRHFHTLKGAAAAVGLGLVAEQLHHGESLLESILEGETAVGGPRLVDFLFRLTDSITGLIDKVRGRATDQRSVMTDIPVAIAALMSAAVTDEPLPTPTRATPTPVQAAEASDAPIPLAELETGVVRILASRLDTLMNQVTQLVVSRTRLDRKIEAFGELRDKLDYCRRRLADLIQGFQENYEYNVGERQGVATKASLTTRSAAEEDEFFTDLEFDKYDDVNILARSVIELATDTGELADQLGKLIDSFGEESRQFSKVTSTLQRQITRLRLVPIDTVLRRLVRPVRDAARQEGKLVDLVFDGGDVQLDKTIVEGLHAPLLHLVRNAVSHGIEQPTERQATGKPTTGTIRISAQLRHNSVQINLQDDGAGIDFDAVRKKGLALGLVDANTTPSRDELVQLIFRSGFSTGTTVTDLAGRGVGMDVVAREIVGLNGTLAVESRDRYGTTIHMVVPTMTAIDEVLLLHSGTHQYAIAADYVEQAVSVNAAHIVDVDGQPTLQVRNELLPVLFLGPLVDQPAPTGNGMAMLLRVGDSRLALIIDRVEPQREAVIRPLGRLLNTHPFLAGATISGDGDVIFTLNPSRLLELLHGEAPRHATFIMPAASDAAPVSGSTILWVDDSISVRKMATKFLESEGVDVDTAVDGIDALEKLASGRFRLVVTDLEMPRMHGYDLVAEIRRNPAFKHLPVIVCSSRSSDKHRHRAEDVGAQGYLTKPFSKEQLFEELERVRPGSTTSRPAAGASA